MSNELRKQNFTQNSMINFKIGNLVCDGDLFLVLADLPATEDLHKPGSRIVAVAFAVALTSSSGFQCQCRVSGTIFHWKCTGFWMKTYFSKEKSKCAQKVNMTVWEIPSQFIIKMLLPYVLSFLIRKHTLHLKIRFFNVKFF